MGAALAVAALDLHGANPWSRLPLSDFQTLEGAREAMRAFVRDSRGLGLPSRSVIAQLLRKPLVWSAAPTAAAALSSPPPPFATQNAQLTRQSHANNARSVRRKNDASPATKAAGAHKAQRPSLRPIAVARNAAATGAGPSRSPGPAPSSSSSNARFMSVDRFLLPASSLVSNGLPVSVSMSLSTSELITPYGTRVLQTPAHPISATQSQQRRSLPARLNQQRADERVASLLARKLSTPPNRQTLRVPVIAPIASSSDAVYRMRTSVQKLTPVTTATASNSGGAVSSRSILLNLGVEKQRLAARYNSASSFCDETVPPEEPSPSARPPNYNLNLKTVTFQVPAEDGEAALRDQPPPATAGRSARGATSDTELLPVRRSLVGGLTSATSTRASASLSRPPPPLQPLWSSASSSSATRRSDRAVAAWLSDTNLEELSRERENSTAGADVLAGEQRGTLTRQQTLTGSGTGRASLRMPIEPHPPHAQSHAQQLQLQTAVGGPTTTTSATAKGPGAGAHEHLALRPPASAFEAPAPAPAAALPASDPIASTSTTTSTSFSAIQNLLYYYPPGSIQQQQQQQQQQ